MSDGREGRINMLYVTVQMDHKPDPLYEYQKYLPNFEAMGRVTIVDNRGDVVYPRQGAK